jgi:hypothetical protein
MDWHATAAGFGGAGIAVIGRYIRIVDGGGHAPSAIADGGLAVARRLLRQDCTLRGIGNPALPSGARALLALRILAGTITRHQAFHAVTDAVAKPGSASTRTAGCHRRRRRDAVLAGVGGAGIAVVQYVGVIDDGTDATGAVTDGLATITGCLLARDGANRHVAESAGTADTGPEAAFGVASGALRSDRALQDRCGTAPVRADAGAALLGIRARRPFSIALGRLIACGSGAGRAGSDKSTRDTGKQAEEASPRTRRSELPREVIEAVTVHIRFLSIDRSAAAASPVNRIQGGSPP